MQGKSGGEHELESKGLEAVKAKFGEHSEEYVGVLELEVELERLTQRGGSSLSRTSRRSNRRLSRRTPSRGRRSGGRRWRPAPAQRAQERWAEVASSPRGAAGE